MSLTTRFHRLSQRQRDILALLLILVVAAVLRGWRLDRFPPGLFGDEAVNGLDALDVLAGRPQIFFPANYGREGLHMLLLAPFVQWLGTTALALRLPSAMAGVGTTLATYWLGRELLARTRLRGTLVPLLAALLLSTSYWHVHFSRFGIRGVFTPLMATLAFAAFWRAANGMARQQDWLPAQRGQSLAPVAARPARTAVGEAKGQSRPLVWFLIAGLFLGLGVHFYTASRLIPIFLGGFLGVQWLASLSGSSSSTHPALLQRAFWPLVAMVAMAAAVFAPLGLYFLRTPGSFAQRASAVSLFNPQVSGGNPWGRLAQAILANIAQFFMPGGGDQAAFYNLPGRPVFDPLLAFLALAGLLLCLRGSWRRSSPHLFLLLWFPAMLLPTFLAADRFPTLPRALGVLPGIYFYPAVALGELARRGSTGPASRPGSLSAQPDRRRAREVLAAALMIIALLLQAGLTWRDYFTRWGPAAETFDAFEGDMAAAAAWLAEHPGQEVYLSADIYRHPSLVYLHEQVPLTEIMSYQDPTLHFFDGRYSMPLPPTGQSTTYLFTHNAGPDPLLEHAPGWPGFVAVDSLPGPGGPALRIARLDAPSASELVADYAPADIRFDPNLTLSGYQLRPLEDESVAVFLLWHMAGPEPHQPHGLQVQAGLQAPGADQQVAQASVELTYRGTEWAPGSNAISWLRLELPALRPPELQLAVRVVNLANGVPLRPPTSTGNGWLSLPLPERLE